MQKPLQKKAVCVLHVRTDGKVLAVARRHTENDWGLPGGKVDFGENLETAAIREMYEETFSAPIELQELYSGNDNADYFVTTYMAKDIQGVPRQGDAGPVAYVTWDELFVGPFGEYNRKVWELFNQARRAEVELR